MVESVSQERYMDSILRPAVPASTEDEHNFIALLNTHSDKRKCTVAEGPFTTLIEAVI